MATSMHQHARVGQSAIRASTPPCCAAIARGDGPAAGRGIATRADSVIHLSVAIGRFFEALLWAVARGVGVMAGWAVLAIVALALFAVALRALWQGRK
jgi:hypothetical protein